MWQRRVSPVLIPDHARQDELDGVIDIPPSQDQCSVTGGLGGFGQGRELLHTAPDFAGCLHNAQMGSAPPAAARRRARLRCAARLWGLPAAANRVHGDGPMAVPRAAASLVFE